MNHCVRRCLSCVSLVAVFTLVLGASTSAVTVTLNPTDDSILRESATTPQGTNPLVIIGDTTNANDFLRSAFAFDLSGAELSGAVVNNVTLRLTADRTDASSENADVVIDFHELTASFTNDDVTWTSRNGTDNWTTPGGDFGGVIASLTANAATVSSGDELDWSSAGLASATQNAIGGSLYLIGKLNVEDSTTRNAFFFESLSTAGAEPELIIDFTPLFDPADVNRDGSVNSLDFNQIAGDLFKPTSELTGNNIFSDIDNSGVVDFTDFRLWKNTPQGAAFIAGLNVPEPSSIVMLCGIVIFSAGFRRRSR